MIDVNISIIANDDAAAEIKLEETPNPGQFTLTRTGDLTQPLTVKYALSGTAINGIDYQNLPGAVTFNAGKSTATIDVNIIDDNVFEGDKNIILLVSPTGGDVFVQTPASNSSSGGAFTIIDGQTSDAILNQLLGKTTGLSNITLTVTGDSRAYGIFNNDPFNLGNGVVLSTGKVVQLADQNTASGTSTNFGGTDPQGGFDPVTLKIEFDADNTAKQVFFEYIFGSEEFTEFSGSQFNDIFTFKLNGFNLARLSDQKTASINNLTPSEVPDSWSTDYIDNSQTTGPLRNEVILDGYTKRLRFVGALLPNSKNTLEIKIKDIGDAILDSAVFLKGGSLGVVNDSVISAVVNITDNEIQPTVSISNISLKEGSSGATKANFTASLSHPSIKDITVDYITVDGTAKADQDYEKIDQATLAFAPGETSRVIAVNVVGDTVIEKDEAFTVNLSNPTEVTLGESTSATANILNDDHSNLSLATENRNLLSVIGGDQNSFLKFTKADRSGKLQSEVYAFVVDDAKGQINGIAPGSQNYLAATIERSQLIFSNLGDSSIDRNFDSDSQRYLNLGSSKFVGFGLVVNSTLDQVQANLQNNVLAPTVLFSLLEANLNGSKQSRLAAYPSSAKYLLSWEDTPGGGDFDFDDVLIDIEPVDNFTPAIGTGLQGKPAGSVVDLRSYAGQSLTIDTVAVSDAMYNNHIAFYAVEDEQGTLANGLKPGDLGYAESAVKSAILSSYKNETRSALTVAGGKILAPVAVSNGTWADFLAQNPQNQASGKVHAFFNYVGANTDHIDHFRLLGDNKFGVEDLYGGGDLDYNDVVFQLKFKTPATST
jgi:hypothetical protein